jgi:hypothetical protein
MPLGAGNIIQVVSGNTGSANPPSVTVTVTAAATGAGNSLVLCFATASTAPDPPAGFTELRSQGNRQAHLVWTKPNVAAGETSWIVTLPTGAAAAWVIYEISGLDVLPYDSAASNGSDTGATPWSTGTTGGSAASDTIVIGTWSAERNDSLGAVGTWSTYTNSFTEDGDTATSIVTSGNNVNLAAAHLFPGVTGSFECTATPSVVPEGQTGIIVVLKSNNSPLTDPLVVCSGFETGTTAGWTVGQAGLKMFDTVTGTMTMQTGTPHTGTYCLRAAAAASAANAQWSTVTCGSTMHRVHRMYVRVISCTGTAIICACDTSPSNGVSFSYVASTNRIQALCEAGTLQTSSMTIALNTWFRLEWYSNFSGTQYIVKWRINGVDQTDALSETGLTAQNVASTYLGTYAGDTITAEFDDVAISATSGDWPIGDGRGVLVKADTAGTAVEIGTANATGRMITNSAIDTTFSSANILAACSEVPVLTGGTATGLGQRTSSTTSACGLPMTTVTLGPGESINGVRVVIPTWANNATAAANTLGVRAFDGSAETILFAAGAYLGVNTASPSWICKMYLPAGGWNQTNLNALVIRIGYSGDILPLPGVHAVYAEVDVNMGVAARPPRRRSPRGWRRAPNSAIYGR